REPRFPQEEVGGIEDQLRRGEAPLADPLAEASRDRLRGLAGDLLVDDALAERLEGRGGGIQPHPERADTIHQDLQLGAPRAHAARMADLQYLMFAENKRALLVVLQAMDTGGKDGTIRHVMTGLNPAGVHVTPSRFRPRRSARTISSGGSTMRFPRGEISGS